MTKQNATTIPLRCRCGAFRGSVDADDGIHVVCYCDDCRAYVHALDRKDLLDENGGSEIWQTTPSRLKVSAGLDQVRCLRLSAKGMLRWHTVCCQTPIGNSMSNPGVPFIGLLRAVLDVDDAGVTVLGPPTRMQARFALGTPPAGSEQTASLRTIARVVRFLAKARLWGAQKPHPFFVDGAPLVTPRVLTPAERARFERGTLV